MSKRVAKTSGRVLVQAAASSVFDFLYYDADRIGSFLAQFDPAGHLRGLKHTESAHSSAGSTAQIGGKGSVGVASMDSTRGENTHEGESEGSERQYDPLWTNAINFLDFLSERNLIGKTLDSARISQFVLASGELEVIDLTMVKEMWSLPSVIRMASSGQSHAPSGNRQARRAKGQATTSDVVSLEQQVGFDLLKLVPHSVQASIWGDGWRVWSSLRQDSMIVSPSDLFLKHGKTIPGEWHMLGIVDALPSDEAAPKPPSAIEAAIGILGGMGFVLDAIGPFARLLLGRPMSAFGMTPLLIFRKVQS